MLPAKGREEGEDASMGGQCGDGRGCSHPGWWEGGEEGGEGGNEGGESTGTHVGHVSGVEA